MIIANYPLLCAGAKLDGKYALPDVVRAPCSKSFNWGPCPGVGINRTPDGACSMCGFRGGKVSKNGKMPRHNGRLSDHTIDCICNGLGWTPATDGWTWWRSLSQLQNFKKGSLEYSFTLTVQVAGGSFGIEVGLGHPMGYHFYDEWGTDDPEAGFFKALYRGLEAMGAKFDEEIEHASD